MIQPTENKKRWYCPHYEKSKPDDFFFGQKRKKYCNLCDGFLGEKLHVNYQKEREQEEKLVHEYRRVRNSF